LGCKLITISDEFTTYGSYLTAVAESLVSKGFVTGVFQGLDTLARLVLPFASPGMRKSRARRESVTRFATGKAIMGRFFGGEEGRSTLSVGSGLLLTVWGGHRYSVYFTKDIPNYPCYPASKIRHSRITRPLRLDSHPS